MMALTHQAEVASAPAAVPSYTPPPIAQHLVSAPTSVPSYSPPPIAQHPVSMPSYTPPIVAQPSYTPPVVCQSIMYSAPQERSYVPPTPVTKAAYAIQRFVA